MALVFDLQSDCSIPAATSEAVRGAHICAVANLHSGNIRGDFDNHHTPLISHTADDIVTAVTAVYAGRHGQPVSNSFGQLDSHNLNVVHNVSTFIYWTTKTATSSTTNRASPFLTPVSWELPPSTPVIPSRSP